MDDARCPQRSPAGMRDGAWPDEETGLYYGEQVGAVIVRPGPRSIPPASAPGGVVLHVYAVPSGRLLLYRSLTDLDSAEATADGDAVACDAMLQGDEIGVCLVAYDGDTGERMRWP